MQVIKKILLLIGILIICLIAALSAAFIVIINSDHVKTQIETEIQARTHLQIKLQGKIGWVLSPQLGASFSGVEVKQPLGFDPHSVAKSEQVEVFIAWRPLLAGQVRLQELILRQTSLSFTQKMAKTSLPVILNGDIQISFPEQRLTMDHFTVNSGTIHATGELTGEKIFSTPEFTGQLNIPQFRLDRDLPTASGFFKIFDTLTNVVVHFDLIPQQSITGKLTADSINIKHLNFTQVSADFLADSTGLHIKPIRATLAGGHLDAGIVDDLGSQPNYDIEGYLVNSEASQLVQSDILQGPVNLQINVKTAGNNQSALLQNLNGLVAVSVNNGKLNHIELLKQIPELRQLLQTSSAANLLHFSHLGGTGKINHGLLTNNDFIFTSPDLQASGNGTLNLVNQQINYQLLIKAQGKLLNQHYEFSAPLTITGTFSKPQFKIDLKSMNLSSPSDSDATKQLGRSLHNQIKNLFGHP
jgi:uncharacterized protein involved in outer membrane biogenesis